MTRSHAFCLSLALCLTATGPAIAGPSLAGDISIEPNPFVSTASRAQVQEDLRQYRIAGINPWADDHDPLAHFRSTMTRAQVMAEFHGSRNEVAAFTGEDSGSIHLAQANGAPAQRAIILASGE